MLPGVLRHEQLPAGDERRRGRKRALAKDAAMPVAKGLLQQCHLQCQKGEACETLAARVTEWRESPPGRLPSSRSSWEPVLEDVRPASGLREALETLLRSAELCEEWREYTGWSDQALALLRPSGPLSYVWTCGAAFILRPGRTSSDTGLPPLTPDHTATKEWRPRAPSSPSTTTARP